MHGRPHAQRLRYTLDEIRAELVQTVKEFAPDALNWAPQPHMKTCKQQLQEIGTMEVLTSRWVNHQELPDWDATWQTLDGTDAEAVLSTLEAVRAQTLAYLDKCTEEELQTPMPLPEAWLEYFGGATVIEPEELMQWVARHEYYHLGQLVTYGFVRNPAPQPKA